MGTRKFKILLLVLGDLAAAYVALAATLFIRYRGHEIIEHWRRHVFPFTLIFVLWLAVLFIVGLYEFDSVHNRLDLLSRVSEALIASFLVSLAVFYFAADFRITPKTNLVITMLIFAALFIGWRILMMHAFSRPRFRLKMAFLGAAPEAPELCDTLNDNPHLGYACLGVFAAAPNVESLPKVDTIVVSHLIAERGEVTRTLYRRFFEATSIVDFPSFYENVRRAVPESAMNEQWILNNVAQRDPSIYDHFKRPVDAALAAILLAPALVLLPLIALTIWLEDREPVFFEQSRVGLGGKPFRILKLRTMRVGAETAGAAFAVKDDPRVTGVGRFLRRTRLDELPQLWNILRGDMSFVGPRPERPEFENELSKTIPLFPVRHLVRPGLTGWAQVNAPYAAAAEDHLKKLRYDLYYLKHRSLTLDAAIILKTIYSVLKRQGR